MPIPFPLIVIVTFLYESIKFIIGKNFLGHEPAVLLIKTYVFITRQESFSCVLNLNLSAHMLQSFICVLLDRAIAAFLLIRVTCFKLSEKVFNIFFREAFFFIPFDKLNHNARVRAANGKTLDQIGAFNDLGAKCQAFAF